MNKLALAAIAAAAAAIPAGASAQPAGHPQSGHSWQERGAPGGHVRLHPGARIHPYWFRPQFHVRNWSLYGFAEPRAEQRWVRHYDDAYLVDREGVVLDGRHGLDWDRYGESWAMDEGIPRYVGEGDFAPEERDYAWVDGYGRQPTYAGAPPQSHPEAPYREERWEEDYGHAEPYPAHEPPCRAARTPCGPAPRYGDAHPGYGYPGYYGCGPCGTMVTTIVETTVTPVTMRYVVTEEVVEEVVHTRRAYRPKRKVRRTPPPPAGERG